MSKKIAVIGGDMRQITMGEYLEKDGYEITVYGFNQENVWRGAHYTKTLDEALENAKIVVLGLPASIDGLTVNSPCWDGRLTVDDLLAKLDPSVLLTAGRISQELQCKFDSFSIHAIDYFSREDLNILNAIPTAEGAIGIAMEELPCTLHNCKCLVAGYGRIGKILTNRLEGFGAKVSCCARQHKDLAWIKAFGYDAKDSKDLQEYIHEFTAIFNTVPSKIFTREVLRGVRSDAVIIDLASKPGGANHQFG